MKGRRRQAFVSFSLAFVFCCGLFFGIGFLILREKGAQEPATSGSAVAAARTEAFSLWLDIGQKQYILDVQPQQAAAFLEPATPEYAGQTARTISADTSVLRSLCEQLGGIDYTEDGRAVKLTGQHLIDRYSAPEFDTLLKLLLTKAFKSRDTLSISYSVLTENNATDISYVDFYENAEVLTGITVY